MLNTYKIVVAAFSVTNKVNQVWFFKKTFLVANVSLKIILGMLFFTLNSADTDFLSRKLGWRTYTTKEALLTTKRVELVGKKKFAAIALDLEHETYVIYVGSVVSIALPSPSPLDVHPFYRPQIAGLMAKKTLTKVHAKYLDFADVFFLDLASKLPRYTKINDHAIELVDSQQPPYRPIYSLGSIELKTLKVYIKINLANKFIRLFKSLAGALILFDRKSDSFL